MMNAAASSRVMHDPVQQRAPAWRAPAAAFARISGRSLTFFAGNQHVKKMFATPQDAEAAFYDAFIKHDLEAMMMVWADEDEIYCVHPRGPRVAGVAQVRESWRQIFTGARDMQFHIREQHLVQAMMVSVHSVYERIVLPEGARAWVLATNIYVRTGGGWRMMVHHASPTPALEEAAPRRVKTLH